MGIEVVVQNTDLMDFGHRDIAGFLFQYPDTEGSIVNIECVIEAAKRSNVGSCLLKQLDSF